MGARSPCFFGATPDEASGEASGVEVGEGVSVSSGVGEAFFFRRGEALGDGDGEDFLVFVLCAGECDSSSDDEALFFFLVAAVADGAGDSSSVAGDGFFRGEALGGGDGEDFLPFAVCAGAGDSSSGGGEDFFLGDALGDGDVFFVLDALFFFRGVGVGVGVEKIFLTALPNDSSAARTGTAVAIMSAMRIKTRMDIAETLGGRIAIS